MVSFDVANLFGNTPLDEAVNIVLYNLFGETDIFRFDNCDFNKVHFKKFLELAFSYGPDVI